MSKFKTIIIKKKEINNPIFIEGLPGISNVARLSVDYLIDKLNAEKIIEIYSDVFPNSVTINDDSTISMFKIELYHTRINNKDLVFIAGDVQPTIDEDSYALCNKLIRIMKKMKTSKLITIGGIGLPEMPDKIRIHGVANNKELINELKNNDIIIDGNETVRIIIGVTGLLLGLARLNNIPAISLLAETTNEQEHVGISESKQVLKALTRIINFELDFNDLDEEIKSYEEEIRESDEILNTDQQKQSYIG